MARDIEKQRAAWRKYYHTHKRVRDRNRAKNQELRDRNSAFVDAKKTSPCLDCGVSYPPYVMDFDHRDSTTKLFCVAEGSKDMLSIEKLEAEIAKCDLVCSNCHRKRTHQRRSDPMCQ